MAQTMECPKCEGEGKIKRFTQWDNGRCFNCRGTGSVVITKIKKKLPVS